VGGRLCDLTSRPAVSWRARNPGPLAHTLHHGANHAAPMACKRPARGRSPSRDPTHTLSYRTQLMTKPTERPFMAHRCSFDKRQASRDSAAPAPAQTTLAIDIAVGVGTQAMRGNNVFTLASESEHAALSLPVKHPPIFMCATPRSPSQHLGQAEDAVLPMAWRDCWRPEAILFSGFCQKEVTLLSRQRIQSRTSGLFALRARGLCRHISVIHGGRSVGADFLLAFFILYALVYPISVHYSTNT
jgi:hypothetical protein